MNTSIVWKNPNCENAIDKLETKNKNEKINNLILFNVVTTKKIIFNLTLG